MCVLCKSKIGGKICEIFSATSFVFDMLSLRVLGRICYFSVFCLSLTMLFLQLLLYLFCPRTDSRAALISSCNLQACANCSRSFSSRKGYLQQQQQLNLTPGILFHLRSVPWIHLGLQILVRGALKLNSGQFWSMKLNSYNSLHLFAGWKCTFCS